MYYQYNKHTWPGSSKSWRHDLVYAWLRKIHHTLQYHESVRKKLSCKVEFPNFTHLMYFLYSYSQNVLAKRLWLSQYCQRLLVIGSLVTIEIIMRLRHTFVHMVHVPPECWLTERWLWAVEPHSVGTASREQLMSLVCCYWGQLLPSSPYHWEHLPSAGNTGRAWAPALNFLDWRDRREFITWLSNILYSKCTCT